MRKIITTFILFCMLLCLPGCGEKTVQEEKVPIVGLEPSSAERDQQAKTTEQAKTVMAELPVSAKEEFQATTEENNPRENILIALDPGHQGPNVDMSAQEPNAPGSSVMKTKATTGTAGKYSGIGEYALNLDIALMVRELLEEKGYRVIMTREDNDTAISNMERACLANDAGADISIRIHANGSEDTGVHGALALVGSEDNAYVGHLYTESIRLAEAVLSSYCDATGMKNLGIQKNDTMTGINWSEIPVMILEMGFMSNEQDDSNMADPDYRKNMASGIVDGIELYYGWETVYEAVSKETDGDEDAELKETVQALLQKEREHGTVASAYIKNLKTGAYVDLSEARHRSASIIKLFIAGCVYQNMDSMELSGEEPSALESLVQSMISKSDNDAANSLVRKLGNGDAEVGMQMVTGYAASLGCTETAMGRLMLDFEAEGENYTTVTETAAFLEMVYNGKIKGADRILSYMKEQERTGKIPAGVPSGIVVANKTGELTDVEHDAAIIYGDKTDYILCVMLSQLDDCARGRDVIKEISEAVYHYLN